MISRRHCRQATARLVHIERGPNISTIPNILPIANRLQVDVALHLGDNISTDYISPAGARALPYRSNIPKIAELSFDNIDPNYAATWRTNALENQFHAIIAGHNYGQGSSREHAAIAPQYLGLRLAIAKSFARIHWQNLINSAVLPLVFENADDWEKIGAGDRLVIGNIQEMIKQGAVIFDILIENKSINIQARLTASDRQKQIILAGGYINWIKAKQTR